MTEEDVASLASYFNAFSEIEKERLYKDIKSIVESHPIWPAFLEGVRGCGPTMASVLISEIDIHRATTASMLWRYSGYGVTEGVGDRRRKGVKNKHNEFLKTKLHVLGTQFLKNKNEEYSEIYANAKTRYENSACAGELASHGYKSAKDGVKAWMTARKLTEPQARKLFESCNCSPIHVHRKAMRYMIKMFLLDLWREWRKVEGLDVRPPYAEEKLGMAHGGV